MTAIQQFINYLKCEPTSSKYLTSQVRIIQSAPFLCDEEIFAILVYIETHQCDTTNVRHFLIAVGPFLTQSDRQALLILYLKLCVTNVLIGNNIYQIIKHRANEIGLSNLCSACIIHSDLVDRGFKRLLTIICRAVRDSEDLANARRMDVGLLLKELQSRIAEMEISYWSWFFMFVNAEYPDMTSSTLSAFVSQKSEPEIRRFFGKLSTKKKLVPDAKKFISDYASKHGISF